jgi:hypothetical protein
MLKVHIRIRSHSGGTSTDSAGPQAAQQNNSSKKNVFFIFVSAYGRQYPVATTDQTSAFSVKPHLPTGPFFLAAFGIFKRSLLATIGLEPGTAFFRGP